MAATVEFDLAAEPVLYRIEGAMKVLNLSRTVIYEQIRAGRLRTVTQGRARRVPVSAIREYVALLEREAGGDR
ncbi:helix-turn-helix domain-containing protein [Streptomyces lunaelactis]|uniref:helix-turn-helix domain-containing protein n=1 Tax=Streptomyces lunaelactis TaxID=1535768 RepID=UPI0015846685|nr:helix-turn-helix domain-containing protein [Streptomyces lunaelactis]NUK37326.1 helix-turn-helix domain-containing protein [Streptomyces lunaelactis]NUK43364.1 helix-turn-helix domain-containing protein [Streptomyces lunaelactis]NUK94688.1 helix-turn-helix domain-containing protein [Streptomyces lunaelactis]NUL33545.1 helix-turn-helix domain-containing protein [Streptomyces lunaelactis]